MFVRDFIECLLIFLKQIVSKFFYIKFLARIFIRIIERSIKIILKNTVFGIFILINLYFR